ANSVGAPPGPPAAQDLIPGEVPDAGKIGTGAAAPVGLLAIGGSPGEGGDVAGDEQGQAADRQPGRKPAEEAREDERAEQEDEANHHQSAGRPATGHAGHALADALGLTAAPATKALTEAATGPGALHALQDLGDLPFVTVGHRRTPVRPEAAFGIVP